MNSTRKLALSAVLSALSVVLLFVGSASQVLDLSCAALCSVIVIFAIIELRGPWPYLIYAVTSLLSVLLLPDKFAAVIYLLFAGYYPAVKRLIEKLRRPIPEWIIKIVLFNGALSLIIWTSKRILGLPDEEIAFSVIVYAVCNAVFILYDIAMTKLITFYYIKLRPRFRFLNKRG